MECAITCKSYHSYHSFYHLPKIITQQAVKCDEVVVFFVCVCGCFSLFSIVFANGFDCILCSQAMWEQTVLYTDCESF